MKGFKIGYMDKTVDIAVNEPISISIIVQKVRGKINLNVGAWLIEPDKYISWIDVGELKIGDEIVIERKEIDKSSTPLVRPAYLSSEDIAEMWKIKKQRFLLLEKKLKEEGLI